MGLPACWRTAIVALCGVRKSDCRRQGSALERSAPTSRGRCFVAQALSARSPPACPSQWHAADALGLGLSMPTTEEQTSSTEPVEDHPTLPPRQDHPAAWHGPAMAAMREEWTWTLTASEIAEIDAAADAVLAAGAGPVVLDAEKFPLPTVGPRLAVLRTNLLAGRGFELVRGLPLQEWPREKAAAAFLGIGSHVGAARSQNSAGHLLGHVRDLGLASDDPNVRIYQTAERQTFHADSCDVVALACLCQAKSGGESLLCSALTAYNEILSTRPDLAAELLRPVAIDRRGEVPEGMQPFFMMAPMSWHAGFLGPGAGYQRQYIDSAQRFPEAPRLSAAQVRRFLLRTT